jgi:hypothetical protein
MELRGKPAWAEGGIVTSQAVILHKRWWSKHQIYHQLLWHVA